MAARRHVVTVTGIRDQLTPKNGAPIAVTATIVTVRSGATARKAGLRRPRANIRRAPGRKSRARQAKAIGTTVNQLN
jgi:hypothetical protein